MVAQCPNFENDGEEHIVHPYEGIVSIQSISIQTAN